MRRVGSSYVLDERVGAGAQGEVWRAHREDDPAATPLAVKLLRAELVDAPGVLDRFLRERATLTRVRSPHVVGVRDMVVEGSSFAIVMDYVGGGDLHDLLAAHGPLPPALAAGLGADVARGLASVHGAGIVHRDLKPANVLLAPTPPEAPRLDPRLADFGIARLADTVAASRLTGAIGTPLYMAPELLDPVTPTPAVDVYALGIVLCECLCGVPPYLGAPAQVLAQHARRDPGRPDGVPDALWDLLLPALAKEGADRPSATELSERLEALLPELEGVPAAARLSTPPPSTPSAVPHEWREEAADPRATRLEPRASARGAAGYGSPGGTTGRGVRAAATTVPAATAPAVTAPGRATSALGPELVARRRRRPLVAALVVLVLALGGAGALGLRWWLGRGADGDERSVASLPGRAVVSELRRLTDPSETVLGPDGTTIAARTAGEWALYDLDRTDQAPAWTGECDDLAYWTATRLLCTSTDAVSLVATDGTTSSQVPGPSSHHLVGTTGDTAVLIDDAPSLADTTLPGGVGTDVGARAFYVVADGDVTVHDATGEAVGTVRDAPERGSWVVSDDVSPEDLLSLLCTRPDEDTVAVAGGGGPVDVVLSRSEGCNAAVPGGVRLDVPSPTEGEACVITPRGLLDGGRLPISAGQPSSRTGGTGERLISFDLSDGSTAWSAAGTLLGVAAPAGKDAGVTEGTARVVEDSHGDVVVLGLSPE